MSMESEEGAEGSGAQPERVVLVLSGLLALLLLAAAVAAMYVVQHRSGFKSQVGPAPTIVLGTPSVKGTATPAPTAQPGGPTPTVTSTARIGQATASPTARVGQATAVATPTKRPATVVLPSPTLPVTAVVTRPGEVRSWYFAEGATIPPFQTFYSVYNGGSVAAQVTVTLYPERGSPVQRTVEVGPRRQLRVRAADLLPSAVFGAQIASEQPIYVERVTLGDRDGTATPGMSLATTWYFPEGRTVEDFTTWLLVLNPGRQMAQLTVSYLVVGGEVVTRKHTVAPSVRLTIPVHADAQRGVLGIIVRSDQPVAAEHSIYFDDQKAAYGGGGLSTLSKTWYVSSGNTEEGFTAQVALLNPHDTGTEAKITVVGRDQKTTTESYSLGPQSKHDIVLNDLADGQLVGAILETDQPVAVQIVTFYDADKKSAAYSASALPTPAYVWYLPDVATGSLHNSYVTVINPGAQEANVTALYVAEDGSQVEKSYRLAGRARMNLWANQEAKDKVVASVEVHSSQPVVAERITVFRTAVGATASAGMPGQ